MNYQVIIAISTFIIVYISAIHGKYNKVIITLLGALLLMWFRIMPLERAFTVHIDWHVILLIVGLTMMIGTIKNTGFFEYLALFLIKKAGGNPRYILVILFFMAAICSAGFDNVTTMIILTQITILIAEEIDISPIPFLITQIIGANIGGSATLIGMPHNIKIAVAADFHYLDFITNISLFVVFNLIIVAAILYFFFRKDLVISNRKRARIMEFDENAVIKDKTLLIYSGSIFCLFLLFMLFEKQIKVEIPVIVITAALLIIYRMKKHDVKTLIKNEIEWETLLFLMGLFIIIGTLGDLHIINSISNKIVYYSKGNIRVLSCVILWISGIFSPLIDNIPLVTAMIPMIQNINYQIGNTVYAFWWSLILGVGFGTNGTLLGGYANIIASDIAKKNNHPISFWTFFRYGSIITLFNLILSTIFILFIL